RLGFEINGNEVVAPYYRIDIEHKADIAEEIARIWGYNSIPETAIKGKANGKVTDEQKFVRTINDVMLAAGYAQINTYSFMSPKEYDLICAPENSELRNSVTITNPLGEDTSVMRTTALPSMMETLALNYNRRNQSVRLFEIATEYINLGIDNLPNEQKVMVAGAYGNVDFYQVKGALEMLFKALNLPEADFVAVSDEASYHPGRTAKILVGGVEIGIMGEIHPTVADNYSIDEKVYVAKLNIAAMYKAVGEEKMYHQLPKFPAVTRDLSMLCDEALPVANLKKAIATGIGDILESIELFDVYRGSQIPEGKKSVAYSFTLRSDSGTLSEKQCTKAVAKAIAELEKLGAEIRS
ncbi:MAG: phenylalanine--tRNA ligase subunit beta, partial [Clostridia bacterium]|nr:phenylalanine--tRNA ligase subunit beta [Clostridia bacterium]